MASKPTQLGHYEGAAQQYQDAGHHYDDDYSTSSDSDSDFEDRYDSRGRRLEIVELPMAQNAEARGRKGHRQPRDERGRYTSRGVPAPAEAELQVAAPAAGMDPADAHYSMRKHEKYSKSHRGPAHFNPRRSSAYPVDSDYDRYYEKRGDYYYGQPDPRQRYAGHYPVEPRAAAGGIESASAHGEWAGRVYSLPAPPPRQKQEESSMLHLDFRQTDNDALRIKAVACISFIATPQDLANGEGVTAVVGSEDPIKFFNLEKLRELGDNPSREHLQHVVITKVRCLGKSVSDNFPWPHVALDLDNGNIRDKNRKLVGMYSAEGDRQPHLLIAHTGEKSDYPDTIYDWTEAGKTLSVDERAIHDWLYVKDKDLWAGFHYLPKPGSDEIDMDRIYLPPSNRALRLMDQNTARYGKTQGLPYSQHKIQTGQARSVDGQMLIPVSIRDLNDLITSLEKDVHDKAPTISVEDGLRFKISLPGGCPMNEPHATYGRSEEEIKRFHATQKKMCKLFFTIELCGVAAASPEAMERARAKMSSSAKPAEAAAN